MGLRPGASGFPLRAKMRSQPDQQTLRMSCEVAGSRVKPWIRYGREFCSMNAALLLAWVGFIPWRRSAGFILQTVGGGWIEG